MVVEPSPIADFICRPTAFSVMEVMCIEVGRGPLGSLFVCSTPQGDVILKAKRIGPYKYDVFSESPRGRYKTIMYASTRRELRRKLEEWLRHELGE
mgnify:CR=1 FL=1